MTILMVTPPAEEPITLDEAKANARVDGTEEDVFIAGLIKSARMRVEKFTRRRLISQVVQLRLDGFCGRILCPIAPVLGVVSVKYLDTAGSELTLAADQYRLIRSCEPPAIETVYGVSWPVTQAVTDSVRVDLTVGYGAAAAVPDDLKDAIQMIVTAAYDNRGTGGETAGLPLPAREILQAYVLWI